MTNNEFEDEIVYKAEGLCCKFGNIDEENEESEESSQNNFLFFDINGKSEHLLFEHENENKFTNDDLKRTVETNSRDLKLSEDFMKKLLIKN